MNSFIEKENCYITIQIVSRLFSLSVQQLGVILLPVNIIGLHGVFRLTLFGACMWLGDWWTIYLIFYFGFAKKGFGGISYDE